MRHVVRLYVCVCVYSVMDNRAADARFVYTYYHAYTHTHCSVDTAPSGGKRGRRNEFLTRLVLPHRGWWEGKKNQKFILYCSIRRYPNELNRYYEISESEKLLLEIRYYYDIVSLVCDNIGLRVATKPCPGQMESRRRRRSACAGEYTKRGRYLKKYSTCKYVVVLYYYY